MIVAAGDHKYHWIDNWARIPDTASGRENGRTHAIVVTSAGDVVVFCQADPAVLVFGPDGALKHSWGDRFSGAHGMTLVGTGAGEALWMVDQNSGEVVKTTLDGETIQSLARPGLPIYDTRKYVPTWAVEDEKRLGGSGDIWVTDGYGSGCIHRYDAQGKYLASINGEEGKSGAFDCPHGIWIDRRRSEPELYIADRGHHRIQVYTLDGTYKRCVGDAQLTSPDGFVTWQDMLVVPELFGRVTLLNHDDEVIGHLGQHPRHTDIQTIEGWPNVPKHTLHPGRFNSPHGAAAAPNGDLYVVEWIIGGRITKLQRL